METWTLLKIINLRDLSPASKVEFAFCRGVMTKEQTKTVLDWIANKAIKKHKLKSDSLQCYYVREWVKSRFIGGNHGCYYEVRSFTRDPIERAIIDSWYTQTMEKQILAFIRKMLAI